VSACELPVNRRLIAEAMLSYAWDQGINRIVMSDFAGWCKANDPEAAEELDKLAANVFNAVLTHDVDIPAHIPSLARDYEHLRLEN
jgi:hypothetical protein